MTALLGRSAPPAGRQPIRHYGDSERDLGRIGDYGEFLTALEQVFGSVLIALKAGGYACVVVMDLQKGDRFFPLHSDRSVRMQALGFCYEDLIIWDRRREYSNFKTLGYPTVFRINKAHEYILVFRKPDAASASGV